MQHYTHCRVIIALYFESVPYDASVWIELSYIQKMNNGGLNNAAFYDDSSDEEFMMDGENHGWNRAEGPVRLLAHRRQLPAVPAPPPIHTAPIAIGTYHLVILVVSGICNAQQKVN